jgi:uncharacterized protein (DUF2345 family)
MPTSAADLARFTGEYSQGLRRITIEAKGSELMIRLEGDERVLQKTGDLEFKAAGARFVFVSGPSGAITFLHNGGRSWKKVR